MIDIGRAGDYVPKVDQKIRRIKELYHAVKSDLPWNLPKGLRKDLVAYAVARLNIRRTTARTQGTLYTRLLKALYGCIQSNSLWFERLTKVLHREGYVHSPTDPCVMRKVVSLRVYLILIYVDDLLLLMSLQEAK